MRRLKLYTGVEGYHNARELFDLTLNNIHVKMFRRRVTKHLIHQIQIDSIGCLYNILADYTKSEYIYTIRKGTTSLGVTRHLSSAIRTIQKHKQND